MINGVSETNLDAMAQCVPLVRCNFPYFGRQSAGHKLALLTDDDTHVLDFRYSPRSGIRNGFGNAESLKFKDIEPEVRHDHTCLTGKAASLPRQANPEAAIIFFALEKTDTPDELLRITLEEKAPVPFITALNCRQSEILVIRVGSIHWIRPRDLLV